MEKNAPEMLREWLHLEGRKVYWFAKKVPAHPSSVSCWLTGARIPDRIRRERMAEMTGLPIGDESSWGSS